MSLNSVQIITAQSANSNLLFTLKTQRLNTLTWGQREHLKLPWSKRSYMAATLQ